MGDDDGGMELTRGMATVGVVVSDRLNRRQENHQQAARFGERASCSNAGKEVLQEDDGWPTISRLAGMWEISCVQECECKLFR